MNESIGLSQHVWLSMRTDGRAGSGLLSNPLNASTPDRLDKLLRGFPPATVINFLPGVFKTRGHNFVDTHQWQPKPGWKIRGSGIGSTVLQLVDAERLKDGLLSLICGEYNVLCHEFELSDLTLDGNHTEKSVAQGNTHNGVSVAGSNIRYSRVRAINFGSCPKYESFVFAAGGTHADLQFAEANNVMEDLIIEQIGHLGGWMTCIQGSCGGESPSIGSKRIVFSKYSVIRNCFMDGSAPGRSFARCNAIGKGGGEVEIIEGCHVRNFNSGWYLDCGFTHTSILRNNTFFNVLRAPHLLTVGFSSDKQPWTTKRVVIEGNDITLANDVPDDSPIGISLLGPGTPDVARYEDVAIRGNSIRSRDNTENNPPAIGIWVDSAENVIIEDNTFCRISLPITYFRCRNFHQNNNRCQDGTPIAAPVDRMM